MMKRFNPKYYIYIGFVLLLAGFILPLLMVAKVLQSTLFLNFFSYIASVLGLMLGVIGIAYITARNRKRNDPPK
jgi:cell division protein FtsX